MNSKLHKLMVKLAGWCQRHSVDYDLAVDEDDLQGALVFRRYQHLTPRLREFLAPLLAAENIYERVVPTRAGTVLLYSLAGISEDVLVRFRDDLMPDYVGAVDQVLLGKIKTTREGRYIFPSRRSTVSRSTWPNFGNVHKESRNKGSSSGRLPTRCGRRLAENLQGIAANYDPSEVKQSLSSIMSGLGIDAQLRDAGIKNHVSDDGQYVVFYNIDQGGQTQPIVRFELSALGEEAKMYEALDFLADLAKKNAPGTGKQEREKQKEQEQAMRELIKTKLPRRPEDEQGNQSLMQPAQAQPQQQQPVGGAKGGGFPVMPGAGMGESVFRGRVASALLD